MTKEELFSDYCSTNMKKFNGFTTLQHRAFEQEEFWEEHGRSVFVQGHTSSGKSLIGYSLIWDRLRRGENPKALYVVPYKALAYQKYEELKSFFCNQGVDIILSTSEYKQEDTRIRSGNAGIVVTIYEKVFLFANMSPAFLDYWNLIILDEFGIVSSVERGIKADFLFLRLLQHKRKMLILATPFYDWSAYANSENFLSVTCAERPVEIEEYLIKQKPEKMWEMEAINTGASGVCRPGATLTTMDEKEKNAGIHFELCDKTYYDMISEVCYRHYQKGHSIIVFLNDKEGVRRLVRRLYLYFLEKRVFAAPDSEEADQYFEKFIGDALVGSGDLYGVYDELEEYEENILKKALCRGITFHSAAQSFHIRRAVEKQFTGRNNSIRIIVATETLAYGVNSNADVVVVADVLKPDGMEQRKMLTCNEYKNYIGRAGRYGYRDRGYAYTLIRERDLEEWRNVLTEQKPAIQSRIYSLDEENLIFYLLSTFEGEQTLSADQIVDYLCGFPSTETVDWTVYREKVQSCIQKLEQNKLIHTELYTTTSYRICDTGTKLRGYILAFSKYKILYQIAERKEVHLFDFAYALTACLNEEDIYTFVPNRRKYTAATEACHGVLERDGKYWLKRGLISRKMLEFVNSIFKQSYQNGTAAWVVRSEGREFFPTVRIAVMITMYLDGRGMRDIYESIRTTAGVNNRVMSTMAYYAEVTSVLATYNGNIEQGKVMGSISDALYYGGLPYRLLYMFGSRNFTADDRETLVFLAQYIRLKGKRKRNELEELRRKDMEDRVAGLSQKYQELVMRMEEGNG